jgi:hypothetical protein
MNLITLNTKPLGTIHTFETNSLFEAIRIVKNPNLAYKPNDSSSIKEIEILKVRFNQNYLDVINDDHIKILNRMNIQVVTNKTKDNEINKKCNKYIFHKNNKWYPVVMFKGLNNTVSRKKVDISSLEDDFVKLVLKSYTKDDIENALKDKKKMSELVNSFISKNVNNVKLISEYESSMMEKMKEKYKKDFNKNDKDDAKIYDSVHFKKWYSKNMLPSSSGGTVAVASPFSPSSQSPSSQSSRKRGREITLKEIIEENFEKYKFFINDLSPFLINELANLINQKLLTRNKVPKIETSYICYTDNDFITTIITEFRDKIESTAKYEFIKSISYDEFLLDDITFNNNLMHSDFLLDEKFYELAKYGQDGAVNTGLNTVPIELQDSDLNTGSNNLSEQVGGMYSASNQRGSEYETVAGTDDKFNDMFSSVLAFCDTIHDFSGQFSKETIMKNYKKNAVYLSNVKENDVFGSKEIMALQDLCLSQVQATIMERPLRTSSMNDKNKTDAEIEAESVYSTNPWEANFMSRFFYSIFPEEEKNRVVKLNIFSNYHEENFVQYLIDNGYTEYFFDMTIASVNDNNNNKLFSQSRLFKKMDKVEIKQTKTNISKWWDPSTGGKFNETQLDDFNKILKTEVLQEHTYKNTSFVFNKILSSGTQVQFKYNYKFHELTIPDNNFTINNCVFGILRPEVGVGVGSEIKPIIPDEIRPMVFYDMKRSGDHGQVMFMKKYNKNMNTKDDKKKKAFLITGDSMCAIKALFEKQPVLFKKYYIHGGQRKIGIYFYDPKTETENLGREYLILKNAEYFNKTNIDKLIEYDKLNKLKPVNGKFNLTLETDTKKIVLTIEQLKVEKDSNLKSMVSFFELHKFFVVEGDKIITKLKDSIAGIKTNKDEYVNIILKKEKKEKDDKKNFAVILERAIIKFEEQNKKLGENRLTIFQTRKDKLIKLHDETVEGFLKIGDVELIKNQGTFKAKINNNVENIDIILTKYIYLLDKYVNLFENKTLYNEYIYKFNTELFKTELFKTELFKTDKLFEKLNKKIEIIKILNKSITETTTPETTTPETTTPETTTIQEKLKGFLNQVKYSLTKSLQIKYLHYIF